MHFIGAAFFRLAGEASELPGLCQPGELDSAREMFLNILVHEPLDPALEQERRGYKHELETIGYHGAIDPQETYHPVGAF